MSIIGRVWDEELGAWVSFNREQHQAHESVRGTTPEHERGLALPAGNTVQPAAPAVSHEEDYDEDYDREEDEDEELETFEYDVEVSFQAYVRGTTTVQATSAEEARRIVRRSLQEHGADSEFMPDYPEYDGVSDDPSWSIQDVSPRD